MPSEPRSAPQWGWAPTKEQHDAIVARRGRNFTDGPMRGAPSEIDPATVDRFSIIDALDGAA